MEEDPERWLALHPPPPATRAGSMEEDPDRLALHPPPPATRAGSMEEDHDRLALHPPPPTTRAGRPSVGLTVPDAAEELDQQRENLEDLQLPVIDWNAIQIEERWEEEGGEPVTSEIVLYDILGLSKEDGSGKKPTDNETEKGKKLIRGKFKCKNCGELGHSMASYKCPLNGTKKRKRAPRANRTKGWFPSNTNTAGPSNANTAARKITPRRAVEDIPSYSYFTCSGKF